MDLLRVVNGGGVMEGTWAKGGGLPGTRTLAAYPYVEQNEEVGDLVVVTMVGATVGAGLGTMLGVGAGAVVGATLDSVVGAKVGTTVGAIVGDMVGAT